MRTRTILNVENDEDDVYLECRGTEIDYDVHFPALATPVKTTNSFAALDSESDTDGEDSKFESNSFDGEIELPEVGTLELGLPVGVPQPGGSAGGRIKKGKSSQGKKTRLICWGEECGHSCCTTRAGSEESGCENRLEEVGPPVRPGSHGRFSDFESPKGLYDLGSAESSPSCTDESGVGTLDEDAQRQPHETKPKTVTGNGKAGRRGRWRHRKNLRRLEIGENDGCVKTEEQKPVSEARWFDSQDGLNPLYDDDGDEELLGSWRTEPRDGWVQVESVVDSGASAPVAPPSMCPNVPVRPSAGSRRGQKYTSASSHKLPNLGEQLINACMDDGYEAQVLYQVAEVSRPLTSVSAICEMGNRVLFGRAGGVIQNLSTGVEIPFTRLNGIYLLSMWLQDKDTQEPDFRRP